MAWYNPACADSWTKWGWYELSPEVQWGSAGQAVLAVEGNLNSGNEFYGFYAWAPEVGFVWSDRFWNMVQSNVFNQCIFDMTADDIPMGFIEFDINTVQIDSGNGVVFFAGASMAGYSGGSLYNAPGVPPGVGWEAYLPDSLYPNGRPD